MSETPRLTVVIPAYKPEFLERTLVSLAAQTRRDFAVYVGDDAGPAAIGTLAARFAGRLDLTYRRFADNWGARDLPAHWGRCVAETTSPWIWLFSDDDTADPDCVAAFYRALDETHGRYDLYRFNTRTVDAADRVIRINPPHPAVESTVEFVYQRLMLARLSFAVEYVFARAAFDREGGFVSFPRAWCSDDASWLRLGTRTGIHLIEGPRVNWRLSRLNLSAPGGRAAADKQTALLQYADWLLARAPATPDHPDATLWALARRALPGWLRHQLKVVGALGAPWTWPALARRLATVTHETPGRWLLRIGAIQSELWGARLRRRG